MPQGWCVFAVGSAGHGSGKAKVKATNGELSVHEDITDLKTWLGTGHLRTSWGADPVWYGEYTVSSRVGYAKHCLEEMRVFFKYCKEHDLSPFIYYTGHGDERGDWCFPSGKVSFQEIKDAQKSVPGLGYLVILSDCCFSGNWVWEGKNQNIHVVSASGTDKEALDRVFANAVFNRVPASQDVLLTTQAMTTTWADEVNVFWFNGNSGVTTDKRP